MRIINDYYRYERLQNQRSKSRMGLVASTKTYADFDEKPFIYIGVNDHIKASRQRKSDLSITNGRGQHLTNVYKPDLERGYAYGDVKNTTDLLLFVTKDFSMAADGTITDGATVEVFICRGRKHDKNAVFNLLTDGELNNEIAHLRAEVTGKGKG